MIVSESIDDLIRNIDVTTSNDIVLKKFKDYKSHILKLLNKFNSYIKQDTKKKDTEPDKKNNIKKKDTEPDIKNNIKKKDTKNNTKNNTKPDTKNNTKNNTKPDTNVDTMESIKNKQKSTKKTYKSLLETKETIRNNINSIYNALKKLPDESQSKLIELVR